MKWAIYNILFALVYPFLLPGFLVRMLRRGGYAARIGDRFALYPRSLIPAPGAHEYAAGDRVWIHAVSVGEVQVAGQLMREWRTIEPDVKFCFSTTSSTGWKIALKEVKADAGDVLIYNPLDFPNFVKSALKTMRPRAIILTESEIWPNFIRQAHKYGVPLFLINARVSDRSAPRYRLARFFFRDVFRCFTRIFAQSALDAERLIAAGAPHERVTVTGSFKFDVAHRNPAKERELRDWIGPGRILLGGSTWPGEDEVLLGIYRELKDAKLVIAPRHFEKADAVESHIRAAGFACVRRSRGEKGEGVYLCDTTGELMGLYGIADVVFVGKSLCAHGSQNMIEPCLCGKPTFVGPYTENFRPVMSDLLDAQAIVQVADAAELKDAIVRQWAATADDLGARAAEAVAHRLGVVATCVKAIRGALCLVLVAAWAAGCSREKPVAAQDDYVYAPVKTAAAYLTLLEKPDATRVLLLGKDAHELKDYFTHAGVKTAVTAGERYDLIVVACGEMTRASCARAAQMLTEDGALAWLMNLHDVTSAKFYSMLDSFDLPQVHLWMPGEERWLLVGRKVPRKVKLSDAIELFTRENAFADLETAGMGSLAAAFANYAGTRTEILPAFATGDPSARVRPEFFLTREIPAVTWLDASDTESDIAHDVFAEMRSMQNVRRMAVEGNMLSLEAKDKKGEEAAIDQWSKALLRNPQELFVRERMDRLERNALGFLKLNRVLQAMKCYETVMLIKPTSASVHNFGLCLKKIGKLDLAKKVLARAKELERIEERKAQP